MGNVQLLFSVARSVSPATDIDPRLKVTTLLRASNRSWGERNLKRLRTQGKAEQDPDDLKGPVPLAVAVTIEPLPSAGSNAEERSASSSPKEGTGPGETEQAAATETSREKVTVRAWSRKNSPATPET